MPLQRPVRTRLRSAAHRGGITLVVGAGVSVSRGIPNWESLAKSMWETAFPGKNSPWDTGLSPNRVPQFLPIVFDLVYRSLRPEKFLSTLKEHLYANCLYPDQDTRFRHSNESLAVVARLLVQEYKRTAQRRIDAVITLNADDLLEQAVSRMAGARTPLPNEEVVRMVARPTHSLMAGPLRRPLPIYHVHGFVPSNHAQKYGEFFDQMLVFTDTQYWTATGSSSSFADRIVLSALSEGRCMFIGISMTDINLLRWLALRGFQMDQDLARSKSVEHTLKLIFDRHFWIRPSSDDPSGFLSSFLEKRGVSSVEIKGWSGRDFRNLIETSFPK